ncbi:MAG: ABC transporter permease [Hyphomicrobiales bacterium]
MILWQTLHQLRLFSRRADALFFVIVMPLIMFFVFTILFGNEIIPGTQITTAQFYAPALAVFGAVQACYAYLAISTATARDRGVLKRIRGTPLPPAVYVFARILAVTVIAIISVVVVMSVGVGFFGVAVFPEKLPMAAICLVIGSICFAALGMMVCALSRTSETTQAVVSATLLPLAFISDVFIRPFREIPQWVTLIADLFPLKHFSVAFGHAFRSDKVGSGFLWTGGEETYAALPDLAIMLIWGIIGATVATYMFKWDPKGEI